MLLTGIYFSSFQYMHVSAESGFYRIMSVEVELKSLIDIARSEMLDHDQKWINFEPHLSVGGNWDILPIYSFGYWNDLATRFPKTAAAVSRMKVNNVMFSKLPSMTSLRPHRGYASVSNSQLRCQLVLVSNENATITVGDVTKVMAEGEVIIFDDSLIHYSENMGAQDRYTLIVDIDRPSHIPIGTSTNMMEFQIFQKFAVAFGISVEQARRALTRG